MWTMPRSRLLRRRCLFLLAALSITCTRVESVIYIKNVILQVSPASTVERGSELTLTCNADVVQSGSSSPLLKFTFFKDFDNHNSVHMLYTNTSYEVKYTINKARASHSGTYKCEVMDDNKHKDSSPQTIIIKGQQTPVLSVDKKSVYEGDTVKITCDAGDEGGKLTFIFKEGSREIHRQTDDTGKVQWNHSLTSVGMADLSCLYLINTGSEILKSNLSNTVSVIVKGLDFTPTITVLPSTQVIEGDSVHIRCGVEGGSRTLADLSLSKGRRLLGMGNYTEYKVNAKATDAGKYECSARVKTVEKSVYANLTVKELFSTPVLTITPTEVFERQRFTLACKSSNIALEKIRHEDVKYSIYRNNQTLSSVNGIYETIAQTETNGKYTCSAQVNTTIIKWSQPIIFTAKVLVSKPIISVPGEVILGRPFQIQCYSQKGSFPIVYKLKRNDVILSQTRVSKPTEKAIFNASIVSEGEIHQFRCEAQNENTETVQMSDKLYSLVTVPVGKPYLMTLPVLHDISEDHNITFVCSVQTGTPPFTFQWYLGESQYPLTTNVEMKNYSKYTLSLPTSIHDGNYYCKVSNSAGKEEVSDQIVITVNMARWKMGLIIGACLLFVSMLILALALLIRYRAKRVKVNGSNGAGIWSVRPPVLDSSEAVDVEEPEEPNVEYTEVLHPQTANPAEVPLKKGTDTVYSEVQSLSPELCVD
ncbi:platelet endothelial cell adhesion molecule isoform 2-T2 [Clarias gariepinus]